LGAPIACSTGAIARLPEAVATPGEQPGEEIGAATEVCPDCGARPGENHRVGERVKEELAKLLVRLDTPPEITAERWAEATISRINLGSRFHKNFDSIVYRVRRAEVVRELGEGHPLVRRLSDAEAASGRRAPEPPPTG
jgi:hypothetical protein